MLVGAGVEALEPVVVGPEVETVVLETTTVVEVEVSVEVIEIDEEVVNDREDGAETVVADRTSVGRERVTSAAPQRRTAKPETTVVCGVSIVVLGREGERDTNRLFARECTRLG